MENPDNLGAAWLVERLIPQASPDEAYMAMASTDFSSTAIIETASTDLALSYTLDPAATVTLVENSATQKTYAFSSTEAAFVVFSEMYYAKGWTAQIDGNEVPIEQVNYVLRGLQVPAGKHQITFRFEPKVVQQGSAVQIGAIVLLLLLLAAAVKEVYPFKEEA